MIIVFDFSESPLILLGLSSYLNELIADPNSRLYSEYHRNQTQNRVFLRGSGFEIQKDYIRKGSVVHDDSDSGDERPQ